jgi:hypothetical protein
MYVNCAEMVTRRYWFILIKSQDKKVAETARMMGSILLPVFTVVFALQIEGMLLDLRVSAQLAYLLNCDVLQAVFYIHLGFVLWFFAQLRSFPPRILR